MFDVFIEWDSLGECDNNFGVFVVEGLYCYFWMFEKYCDYF